MGGCCCCSSKGTELSNTPAYYYYPRALEEHVPLSPHQGASSVLSSGLLVDLSLETSIPDSYRPPPAPIPYDCSLQTTQTPPVAQEISGNKNDAALLPTNHDSVQETVSVHRPGTPVKFEDLKEPGCKIEADFEIDSSKESEIELPKPVKQILATEEEDACPICLDEYDAENPKITTECDHHFHLACILEWMERSETCPLCDQDMIFSPPLD